MMYSPLYPFPNVQIIHNHYWKCNYH